MLIVITVYRIALRLRKRDPCPRPSTLEGCTLTHISSHALPIGWKYKEPGGQSILTNVLPSRVSFPQCVEIVEFPTHMATSPLPWHKLLPSLILHPKGRLCFVIFTLGWRVGKAWLLAWGVGESYTCKLRILTRVCKTSYIMSKARNGKRKGCGWWTGVQDPVLPVLYIPSCNPPKIWNLIRASKSLWRSIC